MIGYTIVMRAIIATSYGSPGVLRLELNHPKPTADKGEFLVKVAATAVNSGDVRIRGLKVAPALRPLIRLVFGWSRPRRGVLGMAFAGTVEALGEGVEGLTVGQSVFGLTGMRLGAYAEYVSVSVKAAYARAPEKIPLAEAAALPFGGSTAIHFLTQAGITEVKGKRALIYGATGAVGSMAVQLAKAYGADVTAVCSTKGVELVERLGADTVISYQSEDVTKRPETYDIIFDAVGKLPRKACGHLLAQAGTYVTVGGAAVSSEKKEQMELLAKLVDEGKIVPVIDRTYPLEEMVAAHEYVDQGSKHGNVLVTL